MLYFSYDTESLLQRFDAPSMALLVGRGKWQEVDYSKGADVKIEAAVQKKEKSIGNL